MCIFVGLYLTWKALSDTVIYSVLLPFKCVLIIHCVLTDPETSRLEIYKKYREISVTNGALCRESASLAHGRLDTTIIRYYVRTVENFGLFSNHLQTVTKWRQNLTSSCVQQNIIQFSGVRWPRRRWSSRIITLLVIKTHSSQGQL